MYLGHELSGLQRNAASAFTVEKILMDALFEAQLVPAQDTPTLLCGRTDAGVSATCQVI